MTAGVQVRARDIAKSVNHGEYDETKCQRNARVSNGSMTYIIDDNGPGAGENEGECAQEFRREFFHGSANRSLAHRITFRSAAFLDGIRTANVRASFLSRVEPQRVSESYQVLVTHLSRF